VRAARLSQGLSQEDLAAESGLDRTYISGLERGARNPALSTIERVSSALQIRASVLLAQAESDA
jgi:transcriptional regulator with XRE-family HTH domain